MTKAEKEKLDIERMEEKWEAFRKRSFPCQMPDWVSNYVKMGFYEGAIVQRDIIIMEKEEKEKKEPLSTRYWIRQAYWIRRIVMFFKGVI